MQKSLDQKIAAIHADPSGSKDFILADAKDADMAFGIGSPGKSPEMHAGEGRMRTLAEYREQIRQITQQGLVDIMLMSASTSDVLTIQERTVRQFARHAGGPGERHDRYFCRPRQPLHRRAIAAVSYGTGRSHSMRPRRLRRRRTLARRELGPLQRHVQQPPRPTKSLPWLKSIAKFREEAERKGFRHFLEVFDPNAPAGLDATSTPGFVNDCIARTLAGVAQAGRPCS